MPPDPASSVSGHRPAPEPGRPASAAPEHDWAAASQLVFPALRPPGMHGTPLDGVDFGQLVQEGNRRHALPVFDSGPAELRIAYVLRGAYDVLVDADHLLAWGVRAPALREAATANLQAWSATAAWVEEASGDRRLLSSATGEGADAARILLPEVRAHLVSELGGSGRVLVGLPERDLLLAGALVEGDAEFGELFGGFIQEVATEAAETIDQRVFELSGDGHELVPFGG